VVLQTQQVFPPQPILFIQILERQLPFRINGVRLPVARENRYLVTVAYISVPLNVPRASANFRRFQDIPYYWLFVYLHGCQSISMPSTGDDIPGNSTVTSYLPDWCRSNNSMRFRISNNTLRMTGDSGFAFYHGTDVAQCVIANSTDQCMPDVVLTDCYQCPIDTKSTLLPEAAILPSNVVVVGIELQYDPR
jgi:hypothetical protein